MSEDDEYFQLEEFSRSLCDWDAALFYSYHRKLASMQSENEACSRATKKTLFHHDIDDVAYFYFRKADYQQCIYTLIRRYLISQCLGEQQGCLLVCSLIKLNRIKEALDIFEASLEGAQWQSDVPSLSPRSFECRKVVSLYDILRSVNPCIDSIDDFSNLHKEAFNLRLCFNLSSSPRLLYVYLILMQLSNMPSQHNRSKISQIPYPGMQKENVCPTFAMEKSQMNDYFISLNSFLSSVLTPDPCPNADGEVSKTSEILVLLEMLYCMQSSKLPASIHDGFGSVFYPVLCKDSGELANDDLPALVTKAVMRKPVVGKSALLSFGRFRRQGRTDTFELYRLNARNPSIDVIVYELLAIMTLDPERGLMTFKPVLSLRNEKSKKVDFLSHLELALSRWAKAVCMPIDSSGSNQLQLESVVQNRLVDALTLWPCLYHAWFSLAKTYLVSGQNEEAMMATEAAYHLSQKGSGSHLFLWNQICELC